MITRRRLLATTLGGIGLALALPRLQADKPPSATADWPTPPSEPVEVTLVVRERPLALLPPPAGPSPVLGYAAAWPPVVRVQRGQPLRATLFNELKEHTSIHWHGVRVPNAVDGVPYLTQPPVEPGERYTYEFTPPDAGTFFFHPHCATLEQLGRGLAGVLVVTGDEIQPFDADPICVIKDWRIDETGAFLPMTTDAGAGRAGTFGTLTTVNGIGKPDLAVPAGGAVRLRILNIDNTRILEVGLEGAHAWLIAVDGNPVEPSVLETWRLGPAQRLDLALQAPSTPGTAVKLLNYFAPQPVLLATLVAQGPARAHPAFEPAPLRPAAIPTPAIGQAETLRFTFSATGAASDLVLSDGTVLPLAGAMCLSNKTFWAINQASWPNQSSRRLPPPLAVLARGRSYLFELVNATPHAHPIHIHGHTWRVLDSNKRRLPPHHADTVLLAPKERIRVAFVADNPGDWMFHCHIIEHQETGMMSIIRVA